MALTDNLALLITRELDSLAREVEQFPDDEQLWRVAPGVTNSAGNLALHVAGNLQHFVGAALGQTGYQRDRDREFSASSGTRAEVLAELRAAASAVIDTLARLDAHALERPMPGAPAGLVIRTDLFLMHLASHAAFHLGQAGYLRRIVTGSQTSSGPMPLGVLATPAS